MKSHYQLLDLQPTASAEEIKRAFRREIARYHPDKVQHLGPEFQEIAATRAAELTEAYRVLMDVEARQKYDESLADGSVAEPPRRPAQPPASTADPVPPPPPRPPADAQPQGDAQPQEDAPPQAPPPPDRRFHQDRAAISDVVRKAIVAKLRAAVGTATGGASSMPAPAFDVAFAINPKKGLFKKAEPAVRLFARIVPHVDVAAIQEVWPLAAKAGSGDAVLCVLLLGTGLAPARELGGAISEQRRKSRTGAPIVIPVDIRDWEALFPPEAPGVVRRVIERLRAAN